MVLKKVSVLGNRVDEYLTGSNYRYLDWMCLKLIT